MAFHCKMKVNCYKKQQKQTEHEHNNKDENENKYLHIKVALIISLLIIVTLSGGMETLNLSLKELTINDNGCIIKLKTTESNIQDVIKNYGLNIVKEDDVRIPLSDKLVSGVNNEIIIKRAVPLYIDVDGEHLKVLTHCSALAEVLKENEIEIGESDRIEGANIEDKIFRGMSVRIVRVKEDLITEKVTISYEVEKRSNQRLEQGVEKTVREGQEGIRELLYRVVYEDGVMVSKELVKETVVASPVNKLVEYGTIARYTTARGDVLRYSKVLNMRATAYTSSFKDTGKNPGHPEFGITYTGIKAKKGIIAVDPNVIPLGTRVYVECPGDIPDYGFALAADTGGAIVGNLIDLYFETQEEVNSWGIKKVKVYILSE